MKNKLSWENIEKNQCHRAYTRVSPFFFVLLSSHHENTFYPNSFIMVSLKYTLAL